VNAVGADLGIDHPGRDLGDLDAMALQPALAPVTSTVFPDNGMPVSFPTNPNYT
jgi:hypothetical protein